MKNTEIIPTIKPYSIRVFEANLIDRDEKTLDKVMHYNNQPVIVVKVLKYWKTPRYLVIPAYSPTEDEFMVYESELWIGKPMKLGKRNNFNLFSNDTDQFNDDELRKEYAEVFDGEPDDNDLYRIACNIIDVYYSDFMEEIERYENVHGKSEYIVLADIGLWHGCYDGGKILVGMTSVIQECIEGLDNYEIYFKNGQLRISGSHHDGSCHYVIRELKDGSEDYIMNHEFYTEPRELHKNLFNSNRWSMRVKMFDILGYGGGIC